MTSRLPRSTDVSFREFKRDDSVGYRHEIIPPDRADDCPYLERWILGIGRRRRDEKGKDVSQAWFSVRLHHFFRSDEDHLHDHPAAFTTLVLRGSYEDWVECNECTDGKTIAQLFEIWKKGTGRTEEVLTVEKIRLAKPYVKQYGANVVERAIAGLYYDPVVLSNGERYDRWEYLFCKRERFEGYVYRSPSGWKPQSCLRCDDTGQVLGDLMTPGKIRFRSALHAHRVVTDGCWTLCLFGPKKRDWGFFAPEGWLRQREYFRRYGGSAACE